MLHPVEFGTGDTMGTLTLMAWGHVARTQSCGALVMGEDRNPVRSLVILKPPRWLERLSVGVLVNSPLSVPS